MESWIKLDRSIMDSWLWAGEAFTRAQAYIDILLMASYCDHQMILDGRVVTVRAGSFYTSIRKLSERWGWSKSKVSAFLNLLVREHMISKVSDSKRTLITLENKGFAESDGEICGQRADSGRTVNGRTEEGNIKDIYKYIHTRARTREDDPPEEWIPPTLDEVREYCAGRRLSVNPDRFYNCYQRKGWMAEGQPITDWRACAEYWHAANRDKRVEKAQEQARAGGFWPYEGNGEMPNG